MIKQFLSLTGILALTVMLASCSVVTSQYCPGEEIAIPEEKLARESIWMCADDSYYVRRSENRSFVAAKLQWNKQKAGYMASSSPIVLSKLGPHMFLNIKNNDYYMILRASPVEKDGSLEELALFPVNMEQIERAISDGKIKAHKDDMDNIVLEGSKEEQDEYIQDNIQLMFSTNAACTARLILQKKEHQRE